MTSLKPHRLQPWVPFPFQMRIWRSQSQRLAPKLFRQLTERPKCAAAGHCWVPCSWVQGACPASMGVSQKDKLEGLEGHSSRGSHTQDTMCSREGGAGWVALSAPGMAWGGQTERHPSHLEGRGESPD